MINRKMTYRPTALALALAKAAGQVDHQQNWLARAVEDRVTHTKVGIKAEPAVNAHLTKRTYEHLVSTGVME